MVTAASVLLVHSRIWPQDEWEPNIIVKHDMDVEDPTWWMRDLYPEVEEIL